MIERKAKVPPKRVQYWVERIDQHVKTQYMRLTPSDIEVTIKLAGLICVVEQKKQNAVFWALMLLLCHKKRKSMWPSVVEILPADPEALWNLAKCLRYYEKLADKGNFQSLRKGLFNPLTVTEIVIKVGEAYKAYLDLYKESFYTYPGKVFSEELVNKAGHKLRGRFGDFGEQNTDYQNEIAERVTEINV